MKQLKSTFQIETQGVRKKFMFQTAASLQKKKKNVEN